VPGVETSPRHHRGPQRRISVRGGAHLRRLPGLDQSAAGPLPARGRGRVPAAIETAEKIPDRNLRRDGRADRPAPQGTHRRRPGRRPAHNRLAPGAPSPGPGVGGDHLLAADPCWLGDRGAEEEAEDRLPAVRRRAAQRDLAGRLHPLPADPPRRLSGSRPGDPVLARRPLPVRALGDRAPPGHRPERVGHLPPNHRPAWCSGLDVDRQRHGVHHPAVRRQGRPQRLRARTKTSSACCRRTPDRATRPPAARWSGSSRP
jgi:hypothetical protein